MTFTYSSTSISTDLAKVRTFIGDTNSNDPLQTDEQINFFLAETDNIYLAAANCIRYGILPEIARRIDRSGTGHSASRDQITQHYKDLADDLEAKAGALTGPATGNLSASDKTDIESDDDFIQPAFKSFQHKNPRST